MNEVRTRIRVGPDHRISGVAPPDVPPGEHEVTIALAPSPTLATPAKKFRIEDLPKHDLGPWPEGLSLRRKNIYDDDGR
jgi:hypothetical protein